MLASLHILAEAATASNTMDAAGIGQLLLILLGGGVIGGGGYIAGRKKKIEVSPDPIRCKKVEDYVTREEHRRDVNHIHALIRDSEKSIHGRMDKQSEQLNQLHGLVTATNRQIDNIAKKL